MTYAIVFPGQGSQSLKMMDGLLDNPQVQEVFHIATRELKVDFLKMLHEDNADNINRTINTQPLLLTAGYATYVAMQTRYNCVPNILAGHSLGEWTALVASNVIDFTCALHLVQIRAQVMQEAVAPGEGSMAAVLGVDDDQIVNICRQVEQETQLVVAAVNFNCPGQVVIAGDKLAVEQASILLKQHGARKIMPVPISVPSHCRLMLNASVKLEQALANITFNTPKIKIIHNCNLESYTQPELIKAVLVKQLYSPVLWTQTIHKITSAGILNIIEAGPGRVLSGLNKRINDKIHSYNIHNQADLDKLGEIL